MGRLLRRRGLALIGTRVFKGTVSVAQGPEWDQGPPHLFVQNIYLHLQQNTNFKLYKPKINVMRLMSQLLM